MSAVGLETPDQLSARSIVAVLATEVSGELRSSDLFLDFAFSTFNFKSGLERITDADLKSHATHVMSRDSACS